jgi:ATP-dependent protease ClpP protease subunit
VIRTHLHNGTLSLKLDGTLTTGDTAEAIHLMPQAQKVVLFIDCQGGCAYECAGLVSALLVHPHSRGFITGDAFSAAAIIARACRQTTIAPTGRVMVHRARTSAFGTRGDLELAITRLAHLDTVPSLILSFRGVPAAEILRLEAEGDHYHSADDALRCGLVDCISTTIPPFPLPQWAEARPEPPCDHEGKLIDLLESRGHLEVRDLHAFDCRLRAWFRSRVSQSGTSSERPYKPPAMPK